MAAEDTEGTKVATGTRKCRALITCHGVHKGAQGTQGVSVRECRVCKEMHGALWWTLPTNNMSLVGT